jgi:hypothetical protein
MLLEGLPFLDIYENSSAVRLLLSFLMFQAVHSGPGEGPTG